MFSPLVFEKKRLRKILNFFFLQNRLFHKKNWKISQKNENKYDGQCPNSLYNYKRKNREQNDPKKWLFDLNNAPIGLKFCL